MGLVLTYRPGEKIFIGEDIVITGLSAHHGQGRILIEAPKDRTILREKVKIRMDAERLENAREKGRR